MDDGVRDHLLVLAQGALPRSSHFQSNWFPTYEEIALGYRLVPLIVGMASAGTTVDCLKNQHRPHRFGARRCGAGCCTPVAARSGCAASGTGSVGMYADAVGASLAGTRTGAFGIIEAYQPYMVQLPSTTQAVARCI